MYLIMSCTVSPSRSTMSTLLFLFSSMSWVNMASKTEDRPARTFLWHLKVRPSQVMEQSENFPLVKIAL